MAVGLEPVARSASGRLCFRPETDEGRFMSELKGR